MTFQIYIVNELYIWISNPGSLAPELLTMAVALAQSQCHLPGDRVQLASLGLDGHATQVLTLVLGELQLDHMAQHEFWGPFQC